MTRTRHNRRDFLKLGLGTLLGTSSMMGAMSSLQALQAAPLVNRMNDFKALVCIFLKGGNDSMNMVVPMDPAEYAVYADARGDLAIPQSSLLPLGQSGYGMNPDAAGFAQLYTEQKLAVLANVGTLIEPTTKSDIQTSSSLVPPKLFSHNDQQRLWMTGDAMGAVNTGWSGRIADMLHSAGVPSYPAMNMYFGPLDLLQLGDIAQPYSLANDGVVELQTARNDSRRNRLHDRYKAYYENANTHPHRLVREYAKIQQRAYDTAGNVTSALASAPTLSTSFSRFPSRSLAAQLETTIKLISLHQQLGTQRQVFFLTTGSWDTHASQSNNHRVLQQELTTNLLEFQRELEYLGLDGQVTSFTASEFGRTLGNNGDGTDHSWGGHSFVMGSAVNGGQFYGQMPDLTIDGPDDAGKGRIIPTTASDQYTATLAKWFGLEPGEVNTLLPRLANFGTDDLGFML